MKTKKITVAFFLTLWLSFSLSAFAGDYGRIYYDLGVFALDEGNFVTAEKHFKDAIEQEPDNPYYQHFLGKTYLESERPEQAIEPLEVAWELKPDITSLQFDLAMAYYGAGQYSKAEKLFSDLVTKDETNVMARYYLGMSYFKQDRYGRALEPLLRSGEENRSIRDNCYYFAGISYYKFDEPEKALEKLDYVEKQSTSEKLRLSARQWQEVIRSQQARSARYNIFLQMGLKYDDNVSLEPVNDDLYSDESDFAAVAYFSGTYNFINGLNRKLGAGLTYYQDHYQDLSEYDLIAGIGSLYYQQRFASQFYLGLLYQPAIYRVDTEEYLKMHLVRPTLLWRADSNKGLRLTYNFTDKDYVTDEDRNGQGNDLLLDFFTLLFSSKGKLSIGAGYGNYDADHPNYSYDQFSAKLDFSYPLPWEWVMVLTAYWERKDYDDIDTVYHVNRQDDKITGTVSLSRSFIYRWLMLQAEYRYTDNDSTIEYYTYKKNVTGLYLITKF